jgi:hypothetical protein
VHFFDSVVFQALRNDLSGDKNEKCGFGYDLSYLCLDLRQVDDHLEGDVRSECLNYGPVHKVGEVWGNGEVVYNRGCRCSLHHHLRRRI